jgi:hypothetical protein
MTKSDSLMVISDDEEDFDAFDNEDARLYIDETFVSPLDRRHHQPTRSTNTGNPFEMNPLLLANLRRCQTHSSQTTLTSNTALLLKRHRSTCCQAEYFQRSTKETNTERSNEMKEEAIAVKQHRFP